MESNRVSWRALMIQNSLQIEMRAKNGVFECDKDWLTQAEFKLWIGRMSDL